MKAYILYAAWLKIPDVLYLILLACGWIALLVCTGVMVWGMAHRKEIRFFRKWVIIQVISAGIIVLTMTGKIAPYMAFGG